MFILFKIKYTNNEFVIIGNLQRLNQSDKDWYSDLIWSLMEYKSEYYNETQIESFVFSYGFKKGKAPEKDIIKSELKYLNLRNNKIPI